MFRWIRQWAGSLHDAYERRLAIEQLSRFSDRELADLGIERGMIPDVVAGNSSTRLGRSDVRSREIALSLQGCG